MDALISSYAVVDGKIEVKTPYSEAVAAQCRKWAGEYDKARGWVVGSSRLSEIQAELGADLSDPVTVEVGRDDLDEVGAQYRVGWYVLASRSGRDRAADVYAELVAGEIPASGGSAKNPWVKASDDARFRLTVARDFAAAKGLAVVFDPKAGGTAAPVADGQRTRAIADVRELVKAFGLTAEEIFGQ